MISETSRRVDPWYRDRGLLASTLFSVVVLAFNEVSLSNESDHVMGLFAVSPMLAAVLVQRAHRVMIASAIAVAGFGLSSVTGDVSFEYGQWARLVALVVTTVVGVVAADARLRNQRRLIAIGEVAKTAQLAIMRLTPPKAEGVDAAVRYVSASTEANIGGDAYEALLTPFGLRVLVADARGKGIPAVLPSAVTVGAFREWAYIEESLADLLCRMNTSVSREVSDSEFVTALVAEFRNDQLRYVCAGHPRPVLLRDGHAGELPTRTVPPLSLIDESRTPEVSQLRMQRDDVVLMFSDGLTDSRNEHGEFFGVSEALLRVAEHAVDVEECADGVLKELRDFVKDDLEDDVALVALRITQPVEALESPPAP